MKMRLAALFFCNMLLCLFISVCNGAPPDEFGVGISNNRFKKYTEEEDQFIVEELSRLLEQPYSRNIWKKLTNQHIEKCKAGTSGFPHERPATSLRSRFWNTLVKNNPQVKVKVPETLLRKLKKADSNTTGENAGGSTSTVQNEPIDSQETNEELDTAWDDKDDKKVRPRYTKEEDNFIIDELSSIQDDNIPVHGIYLWKNIAENYRKNWNEGVPGFREERTAKSLYKRFVNILMSDVPPNGVTIPEILRRKLANLKFFSSSKKKEVPRPWYTKEEDKFIMKLLSKSSQTGPLASSTLESIRAEHDKKRLAKIPGFENKRTAYSLRGHIARMKNSGLPDNIQEKFMEGRRALSNASGASTRAGTSGGPVASGGAGFNGGAGTSGGESSHQIDQDDSEFDEIIEEFLRNTEFQPGNHKLWR